MIQTQDSDSPALCSPARAGVDEWEAGPLRPILSPGRFQPAPG